MSKKWLTWYYILHKRLFKKPGFLVILCAILVLTLLMTLVSSQPSGFVRVAVAAQDAADPYAAKTIERLSGSSEVVQFITCSTPEQALQLLHSSQVDTAWVFNDNLEQRIQRVGEGRSDTLVRIYAAEDSIFVRSAREKLYAALFPDICYRVYEHFVRTELTNGDLVPAELIRNTYDIYGYREELVNFTLMDEVTTRKNKLDYLTSPMRGLLAVLMLFCGLAATMYFKNDERKRVFATLSVEKRLLVFFGNNMAALSVAGVFVTAALLLSGMYTNWVNETVMMLLYVVATAGFCALLGTLCTSNNGMGALLPVLLVGTVAMTPVFFACHLPVVPWLLPAHYYLYGIYDPTYALYLLLYCVVVYALVWLLYCRVKKHRVTGE